MDLLSYTVQPGQTLHFITGELFVCVQSRDNIVLEMSPLHTAALFASYSVCGSAWYESSLWLPSQTVRL